MNMKEKLTKWKEQIGLKSDFDGLVISEADESAAILLLMIHKGFNSKVWSSKLMRYWGAFEEKAELHLGAQDLAEFSTKFAGEMQNGIGRNKLQRGVAIEVTYCEIASDILARLQVNHKMIVTLVRAMKDAIKSEYDYEEAEEIIEIS